MKVRVLQEGYRQVVIGLGEDVCFVPFKHHDERRTIYEAVYGHGVIQFFQIHDGSQPLGVHFHKQTREEFFILNGGGSVLLSSVDEEGRPIDDKGRAVAGDKAGIRHRQLRAGSEVKVNPLLAHAFFLRPGSEMVCVASLPYDPDDVFPTPWLVK